MTRSPTSAEIVATTPLVVLREPVPSDAFDEYTWRRDPELARHHAAQPLQQPFSEFLEQFEADISAPDPTRHLYAIDDAESGSHIGSVMYYRASHAAASAEFGVTIGPPDARGRGCGYQATVAFLRHVWRATPFRRITLVTLAWNEPARRCFERAGFSATGNLHRDGQEFISMEALREWWLLWDQEGRFPCLPPSDGEAERS